ncbi:predicted protein [Sclerotinia sclerotiorum 1980 UF-70]|uniref:Uncharacterized protein n=1 Tax=Sclerotinia sclerotiorum (strain ATCC 18683 / 1980 / Ss-1) TaxID=665079 RepID=A7EDL8_SCLS1|nr:predicted protein [Sclerotinia sclerotiorum 1980 UF-70]EDO00934.1 predicted protein [Sclerotinia sclerotiorum 1980 UF-70]
MTVWSLWKESPWPAKRILNPTTVIRGRLVRFVPVTSNLLSRIALSYCRNTTDFERSQGENFHPVCFKWRYRQAEGIRSSRVEIPQ